MAHRSGSLSFAPIVRGPISVYCCVRHLPRRRPDLPETNAGPRVAYRNEFSESGIVIESRADVVAGALRTSGAGTA
jgi:hypothetical protein